MTSKIETPKAFDCIEFKRQSQQRLRSEYEERRSEFGSYVDFLRAKVMEDEWSRRIWEGTQEERAERAR